MSLPKTLTISVTQKHIDKGKQKDCIKCPIALATCDLLKSLDIDYVYVRVDVDSIDVMTDSFSHREEYALPHDAVSFLHTFDDGFFVEPFDFTAHRVMF